MGNLMLLPVLRAAATAGLATTLLAGCGSSTAHSPTASSAAAVTSTAVRASASAAANPALSVALGYRELPAALPLMTQVGDGLLGTTPNTDARVFGTSDNTTRMEVDLALDTGASAASADYAPYSSAAAKQVATQTTTSTPSIGSQANEYVGTDSMGRNIVAIAFVQGSVLCVVTYVSTSAADAAAVESVATAQAQKISAANL
jgi:hypothetical protein